MESASHRITLTDVAEVIEAAAGRTAVSSPFE
jgi:hypothetical protein